MADKTEREIAVGQQEKLQFYLVSLVFTLLALAVQSAKFAGAQLADYAELAGWVALLISGVAGLRYLEMNPVLRVKMAERDEYQESVSKLRQAITQGQRTILVATTNTMEPVAPILKNREAAVAALDGRIPNWERWQI